MKTNRALFARLSNRRRWLAACTSAGFFVLTAAAATATDIDRVEEDWKLVVSEPDTMLVSPQVTCTMSPVGNLGSDYAVFDVNLRNFPSYEAGGVQLQIWNGDNAVTAVRSKSGIVLQHANETVTWTQVMALSGETLSFGVTDGQSTSWGAFGDGNSIKVSQSTNLENLNGYTPAVTLSNSGVGFGSNRVTSLELVAIRLYAGPTLVAQITAPSVVYPKP